MPQDTVEGPATTQLLLASNFYVKIDGLADSMFTDVGGLSIEIDTVELKYADSKGKIRTANRPGLTKYGEITLKRQMSDDKTFYNWVKDIRDGKVERKGGTVTMVDATGTQTAAWAFKNAWPSKWAVSDLDASSADPPTEDVTLQIEFIERTA